jgi:hypothetical protein
MKTFRATAWLGAAIGIAAGAPSWAQAPTAPASYGPGRIICRSAKSCELDIGAPTSLKYHIDPSALATADKDRLTKQCMAKGTPCVATVTGVEAKNVVKAASIRFYN